ncbi:MAG: NUDIX domain-containing protein [Patescibacteria group bacterium]
MAPHIHEKVDLTAEVFVVYRDKVLLRMHDKYHFWMSVGGHIEIDEDPNQAAVREVKEEVGLDVILWSGNKKLVPESDKYIELIPPVGINRHRVSLTHEHITMIYFATSATDKVVPEFDDDRSDEWKWCTKEDLKKMDLLPNIKFYAELALDTLGAQM